MSDHVPTTMLFQLCCPGRFKLLVRSYVVAASRSVWAGASILNNQVAAPPLPGPYSFPPFPLPLLPFPSLVLPPFPSSPFCREVARLKLTRGLWESVGALKLPHWGLRRSPSQHRFWYIMRGKKLFSQKLLYGLYHTYIHHKIHNILYVKDIKALKIPYGALGANRTVDRDRPTPLCVGRSPCTMSTHCQGAMCVYWLVRWKSTGVIQ